MRPGAFSIDLARRWWHCGVRVHHAGRQQHTGAYQRQRSNRDPWTLYVLFAGHLRLLFAEGAVEVDGPVAYLVAPQTAFRECGSPGTVDQFVAGFHLITEQDWNDPLAELVHPHPVPIPDPQSWSAWCDEAAACFDHFRQIDLDHCIRARPPVDRLLASYLSQISESARTSGAPGWLNGVVDRMFARIGDPDLDHAQIVQWSAIGAAHLNRVFQRWYGISPMRFLRRERMQLAARLLRTRTEEEIGAIARRSGYHDQALFSRHFRAQFGMPPRVWRSRRTSPTT